jgi:hypothetical protein
MAIATKRTVARRTSMRWSRLISGGSGDRLRGDGLGVPASVAVGDDDPEELAEQVGFHVFDLFEL